MSDFSEASAVEAMAKAIRGSTWQGQEKNVAEIALAALKPFMRGGWQDIATAPKDGTEVLLWCSWSDGGTSFKAR